MRYLFLSVALFIQLFAEAPFSSCRQKIRDSHSIVGEHLSLPLTKHRRLIFSHNVPNAKVLKHDPYLSLYIVKDKKYFISPFRLKPKCTPRVAAINKSDIKRGRVADKQVGLNTFAHFSTKLTAPSILTTLCCDLEGIATPEGIIEKAYLKRFITTKQSSYADIGIRVKRLDKHTVVIGVNPFFEQNPFRKGDILLTLNNKKITHISEFMKQILFSKIGTLHTLKVKRDDSVIILSLKSKERLGGGYISDTFLETRGFYFDKALVVTRVTQKNNKYSVKVSDTLLQVNGEKVFTQAQVMQSLDNTKKFNSLLFSRNGFQFFVQIN